MPTQQPEESFLEFIPAWHRGDHWRVEYGIPLRETLDDVGNMEFKTEVWSHRVTDTSDSQVEITSESENGGARVVLTLSPRGDFVAVSEPPHSGASVQGGRPNVPDVREVGTPVSPPWPAFPLVATESLAQWDRGDVEQIVLAVANVLRVRIDRTHTDARGIHRTRVEQEWDPATPWWWSSAKVHYDDPRDVAPHYILLWEGRVIEWPNREEHQ